MKIGMLLPALVMAQRFENRIFAPKALFLSLVDGLIKRGHQITVYATSNTKTKAKLICGEKKLEEKDYASIGLRHDDEKYLKRMFHHVTRREYELDLTIKALHHARAQKLDIIHSYHGYFAHYLSNLIPEIPIIYTLHDPSYVPDSIEGWRIDRFCDDKYIAISHHQAASYENRVKIIDTIHHGLDTSKFPFCQESDDYYVFMGRSIPNKGAADAIKAIKELGLSLQMATSENYLETPYYKRKLRPLLESSLIKVMGFLHEEKRNEWVKRAKALLFPIKWDEPFGMVMIEAMACGVPVIAYERGSVPEVVVDGVTGFIIDDKKSKTPAQPASKKSQKRIIQKTGIEGLKEALKRINSMSAKEYGTMRENCRKHVEKNFTAAKMVSAHERVYKKILES